MGHFFPPPPPQQVAANIAQPFAPTITAALPGWSVDAPPGIEAFLVISWLSDDANPQSSSYVVQPFVPPVVNNPPFTFAGRSAWIADLVVRAWQPPDPSPTLPPRVFTLGIPVTPSVSPPGPSYRYIGWYA